MSLIDLVLTVHDRLGIDDLPHAFGGALAPAYVAEPRETVDIDLNFFATLDEIDRVLAALAPAGPPPDPRRGSYRLTPIGWVLSPCRRSRKCGWLRPCAYGGSPPSSS